MTIFRPPVLQSKISIRFSSSSFVTKKWPLSHPNRRRLQRLRHHLQRDELLIRPPSPSLAPTKNPGHLPEPTPQDLKIVALHASIPFVGFGIMDNGILILAGIMYFVTFSLTNVYQVIVRLMLVAFIL